MVTSVLIFAASATMYQDQLKLVRGHIVVPSLSEALERKQTLFFFGFFARMNMYPYEGELVNRGNYLLFISMVSYIVMFPRCKSCLNFCFVNLVSVNETCLIMHTTCSVILIHTSNKYSLDCRLMLRTSA